MTASTNIIDTSPTVPGGAGWLTDSWYLAAVSARLKPGHQARAMILGQPVVIGRTRAGEVFALRDICPHRLVPLSAGRQIETAGEPTLECPYHGWRFGTDGVCRLMPSLTSDTPYDPSKVRVRRYPIHETNGAVFIFIAANPRFDGVPDVPVPDFGTLPDRPKFVVEGMLDAHIDDAIEGLMDPASVPCLHDAWRARPASTGLKPKDRAFVPAERGWAIARHQPSAQLGRYKWSFGAAAQTEIMFQLPGYRWQVIWNDRARLVTLTCLTPQGPQRTRVTQLTWWTGMPLLNLASALTTPMARKSLAKDHVLVDLYKRGLAPPNTMLWIDDTGVQANWYQSLKLEWTSARTAGRAFKNPLRPVTLRWRS